MQLPSILVIFRLSGPVSVETAHRGRAICAASINPSDFWFAWTSFNRNHVDHLRVSSLSYRVSASPNRCDIGMLARHRVDTSPHRRVDAGS